MYIWIFCKFLFIFWYNLNFMGSHLYAWIHADILCGQLTFSSLSLLIKIFSPWTYAVHCQIKWTRRIQTSVYQMITPIFTSRWITRYKESLTSFNLSCFPEKSELINQICWTLEMKTTQAFYSFALPFKSNMQQCFMCAII